MSGQDREAAWREDAETWTRRDEYQVVVREFQDAFDGAVEDLESETGRSLAEVLEYVSPCLSACDVLAVYGLESSFGTNPAACPPDGRFDESPWCGFQFDRETAEEYGLTVDEAAGTDERADRAAAAGAAARYLLYLGRLLTWRRFSSLGVEGELSESCLAACAEADCEALRKFVYASYNARPAAVARARVRAGSDSCDWDVVKRNLPAEAREYGERGQVYRDVFCPPADGGGGGGTGDGAAPGSGDREGGGREGGDGHTDDGGRSGGEGCFIATAAYGTPTAAEIDVLRAFRDEVLRRNALGRLAVRIYYRTSPPVADWLARSDRRRRLARRFLVEPAVGVVRALRHRT